MEFRYVLLRVRIRKPADRSRKPEDRFRRIAERSRKTADRSRRIAERIRKTADRSRRIGDRIRKPADVFGSCDRIWRIADRIRKPVDRIQWAEIGTSGSLQAENGIPEVRGPKTELPKVWASNVNEYKII
jgi:hypothetical protein